MFRPMTHHPDPEIQKRQLKFLEACEPDERRFHELVFMVGNVTFRFHQLIKDYEPGEEDWNEWVSGLTEPEKTLMEEEGFENGKGILAFTRYVMEKNDVGLEQYLRQHIDPKDFDEFETLTK